MLRFLRIRNLAVIETVEVEFGPGLNVLTGETGAGKSMLVDAVSLLLGARAVAGLVRTGETTATVEALFETDEGTELVVRRDITSQGRSRAYLDGDLTTVAAVREQTSGLVELHGQNEHQALLDPEAHLWLLDRYMGREDLQRKILETWESVHGLRAQLRSRDMDERERTSRLELVTFQLGEIERVGPQVGEDDKLEAERRVLASAERVRGLCETAYEALYEREDAVLPALATIWRKAEELAALDPVFEVHVEARETVKSQLEDLAHTLRARSDGLEASPGRIEEVEERLVALEGLKRKYGPSLAQVAGRAGRLIAERDALVGTGESTAQLEKELAAAEARYREAGEALTAARQETATRFAAALESLLGGLAMQTGFEVRFDPRGLPPDAWGPQGVDRVEFYLSPNTGEEMRPLAQIASGGELSRIMLALKTLGVGGPTDPPAQTLVFDEVDAGIGGQVAGVVGGHLRGLGETHQVLCITHLPQIAACGETQFRIEKTVRGTRTVTAIERLDRAGRVAEIGRMIGGGTVTEAVTASAGELLVAGERGHRKQNKNESKGRQ